MKLYAVIDTNVLVSALLRWDSVPGAVLEQALIGSIVPLLSDELTQETTILTGYLDELRMAFGCAVCFLTRRRLKKISRIRRT